MDESALLQGQVASGSGLGGTDMARGCRAAAAASAWPVGRGGAAWRVAVRRGVRGEVLQSGPKPWGQRVSSGAGRAIRALCSRSGRARDVFDTMPEHARGRGRGWQLTDPG